MASPKGEPDARPARFYKAVTAVEVDGGWAVALDQRRLRTPAGAVLALPTRALAELLVEEWANQGQRIDIAGMSLTRLANAALDRTPQLRAALADEAARHAETDLVCYVADRPEALRAEQDAVWAPLRAWCAETLGVALTPVEGLMPVAQPPASIEAVRRHVNAQSDLSATALVHVIGLLGSAVLGLTLQQGRLSPEAAHAASRLDETFQARQWGEDEEAAARALMRLQETILVRRWFEALPSSRFPQP